MNLEDFNSDLADILDMEFESVMDSKKFGKIDEWDSLQILSLISIVDEYFHIALSGDDLYGCASYEDLLNKIKNNEKKG